MTLFRIFEMIEKVRSLASVEQEIDVQDHQILTREIMSTLKPLEEIIQEHVFCLGGNRDHVPSYVLYDHVMNPLTAQQERKTRKDCGTRSGRHSTSSSFAFAQPSSSHLYDDDDDDGNDEGTSRASTPSPIRYVNSLTNKLRDEHRGGLRIIKKGLRNLWRNVKKKPSNPQPLQSHPSLDITLCLSPITPLDHILDNPSPPSPPQPQPPIMGHPFYYNYHDYHRSTCICCSHNRNLFLTLRDEMNIMFAHLEYLLTTAITSHFSPPH
ncbi:hypothetical protein Tco_0884787 [Tanacetum coccineum]